MLPPLQLGMSSGVHGDTTSSASSGGLGAFPESLHNDTFSQYALIAAVMLVAVVALASRK